MKKLLIWFGVLLLIAVIAIFLMGIIGDKDDPQKGVLVYAPSTGKVVEL